MPEAWVMREMFEDWQLQDPEGESIDTFGQVRDQVKERVVKLIDSLA